MSYNVTIDWTTENNGEASSYNISRREVGGTWANIGSVLGSTNTFTDTGVVEGSYEYKVEAYVDASCTSETPSYPVTVSSSSYTHMIHIADGYTLGTANQESHLNAGYFTATLYIGENTFV